MERAAQTIALVEDERDQRENCADALRAHGYSVETYEACAPALAAFEAKRPDLTILDVIVGADRNGGFELCRKLLARAPDHPVIFLTTRADEVSQVSGLTLGAWDYQPKPVSLRVLAEKVGTLLRLAAGRDGPDADEAPAVLRRGPLELDEGRMRVRWRQQELDLTLAEFRILAALVRWPGHVASYEALMDAAQLGIVTRNTVSTHVLRVRRKLRVVDPSFACIQNEYGLGYRWSEAQ